MAYASKLGRARVSSTNPQAAAVCDRCGSVYNHCDLTWQHDFRGPVLQNTRILVCRRCLDVPQEQLRTIVVPADPVPIMQPRTQDYLAAETDYSTISAPTVYDPVTGIPIPSTTTLLAQDGSAMTENVLGVPDDIDINAVMPLSGTTHYRVPLSPLSITSDGSDQITVTFSAAHGQATGNQIVVQGLSNVKACGAYSITVTTATAFTYQTNVAIPATALLTGSTLMVTANIGLPRGYVQIPQTGV